MFQFTICGCMEHTGAVHAKGRRPKRARGKDSGDRERRSDKGCWQRRSQCNWTRKNRSSDKGKTKGQRCEDKRWWERRYKPQTEHAVV